MTTWFILVFTQGIMHQAGYETLNKMQICSFDQGYALESRQVQSLLGKKPVILLASGNIAGTIQFLSPYSIIAGNYDYEVSGLKDISDISYASTPEKAFPLLKKRKVGAILACPSAYPKESWIAKMDDKKQRPSWLAYLGTMKVPDKKNEPVMLFRIKD
jgi:hypothetical protein